ncbi:TatD family nuclease-associated radical SAM protein [Bengtsoniella intestinalis]|uniref:TatD family nuclease-associated radical SAM protein n=1 Tax=Bengtsoniella intestinalis TaxID=3073143 RepID=UPI00391F0D45
MSMPMTITYTHGDNLYVNTTNRCDFACTFCLRHNGNNGSIYTDNLWLEREPTKEEILADIQSRDLNQYAQLVFCGFGEPSYRIDDIGWVIDQLKAQGCTSFIRMDTNGTGCQIHNRDICPDFANRFDMVSISLNAETAEQYDAIVCSDFTGSYEAMLAFAKEIQKYVPHVLMTVVDVIGEEAIEKCRAVCDSVGADFRVRAYIAE